MVVICVKYPEYLNVQTSDIASHCIEKSNYNFIILLMKLLKALDKPFWDGKFRLALYQSKFNQTSLLVDPNLLRDMLRTCPLWRCRVLFHIFVLFCFVFWVKLFYSESMFGKQQLMGNFVSNSFSWKQTLGSFKIISFTVSLLYVICNW